MEYFIAIVLMEDSLAYNSEGCDQTHMQPKESGVKWVVAAESTQNEVQQENYREQNALVKEVLLQQNLPSIKLSPVLE